MIKKEFIVEKSKKIHSILQDFGFSFADVNKMLRNKDVKIDDKPVKENILVDVGSKVTFFYSKDMLEKKYEIIYEDEDVYLIYKYAGIEVEGERGLENLLKNAIAVHRLDRNTEGLMYFAKNEKSATLLKNAIKNHKIHKFYITEVVGKFDVDKIFTAYLIKNSDESFVKIYSKPIKGAVKIETRVKTLKSTTESSVLEVELITGRTHQIRAHLAFLGHPIIGDGKYGKNEINKKFQQNKQKLACFLIKNEYIGIKSIDFKEFMKKPRWIDKINF